MKRILSMMLAMLIVTTIFVLPASAEGKKSGLFTYEINGNGTAIITDFDWNANDGNDIYIPNMLDGYTVTEIGAEAFADGYQEVVVIIPNNITVIGDKAFFSSHITSAHIPASVQWIGSGAFADCDEMRQFSVDPANPVYATIDGVLYNKQIKELVAYPEQVANALPLMQPLVIPEGIRSIGNYAFYEVDAERCMNHWTVIQFPSTLQKIGDYAFYGSPCRYNKITVNGNEHWNALYLPASVTEIGEGCFAHSTYDGHLGFSAIILGDSSLTTIPDYAFENCRLQGTILTFPDTLRTIGISAFSGFSMYDNNDRTTTLLTIPKEVEEISERAFYGVSCDAIVFEADSNLRTIGNEAFAEYVSYDYSTLTLPERLQTIGDKAFYSERNSLYNDEMAVIIIPSSVMDIGNSVCNRASAQLQVTPGTYAALYASENGYTTKSAGGDDTSWLNE